MQLYDIFLQHPIICTDSRVCPEGSLFFALKGDNFNANAFALSALEKGCAFAVVDEAEFAIDERFVLVENVLEGVMATKSELYKYIFANGKDIFINKDNEFLVEMANDAGFVTSDRMCEYSLDSNEDICNIY